MYYLIQIVQQSSRPIIHFESYSRIISYHSSLEIWRRPTSAGRNSWTSCRGTFQTFKYSNIRIMYCLIQMVQKSSRPIIHFESYNRIISYHSSLERFGGGQQAREGTAAGVNSNIQILKHRTDICIWIKIDWINLLVRSYMYAICLYLYWLN
jgi:hypothetical protein